MPAANSPLPFQPPGLVNTLSVTLLHPRLKLVTPSTCKTRRVKKRTLKVSVWSDDERRVADFVNGVRLLAQSAFGDDNQDVVFTGVGVKRLRAALEGVEWKSANVRGHMKLDD